MFGGPATVLNAAAGFTGTALIQPGASQQRISNLAANCGAMSFVDFGNTFMNYFEADHLVVTGAAGGTAHMWTGSNLHRSVFRDCLFTQNGTAVSIWAMGAGVDPSDISISSDTTEVTLTNIAKADSGGGQAVQINLGTPSGAIRALIQSVDATAVILNQNSTAGQATIVMGNGAITLGGTAYTNP